MIAFVRALLQNREIMVLDEPTSNLDNIRKIAFIDQLKRLKDSGKTVIIATHDKDLINLADNVLQIEYESVRQRRKQTI